MLEELVRAVRVGIRVNLRFRFESVLAFLSLSSFLNVPFNGERATLNRLVKVD